MAVSRFENTVETFALDVDEGTLTPRFASGLKPFFWHEKYDICSYCPCRASTVLPAGDADPTYVAIIEN